MSKCNAIAYKISLAKEIPFGWSIAYRVGTNVTVITSIDVVGVCIFKVALTVYQPQISNLDTSNCLFPWPH